MLAAIAQNRQPITPKIKAQVLRALNEMCDADSRLIENLHIRYVGPRPHDLSIDQKLVKDGWYLTEHLKQLIAEDVVSVRADVHFVLKGDLSEAERNRVSWLHAGLLGYVFPELIDRREYNYDKQVADHWYVWRM